MWHSDKAGLVCVSFFTFSAFLPLQHHNKENNHHIASCLGEISQYTVQEDREEDKYPYSLCFFGLVALLSYLFDPVSFAIASCTGTSQYIIRTSLAKTYKRAYLHQLEQFGSSLIQLEDGLSIPNAGCCGLRLKGKGERRGSLCLQERRFIPRR